MQDSGPNQISSQTPEVSILVLTHNRRHFLERNLNSIFKQTFTNYEILLLDDCSADNTEEYVKSLSDKRIRYYRNETNRGKAEGDWWAIRKCIYELMRGNYFIYLCDDDYWLPETLLEDLVDKHHKYPNLSFAFGMHAHCDGRRLTSEKAVVREVVNCYTTKEMFPEGYMSGLDYLIHFASNPCGKNYLEGGTLFSRQKFLECNAFSAKTGTKWQAGYMFKMGIAAIGDVFFIDKPFVIAGVDSANESYSRTQVDHFWDIVKSISDSYAFLKASAIYETFRPSEKQLIFRLYNKTFCRFVQTWYRNQILYNNGFYFPNTPHSYFRAKLGIGTFIKAFRATCFKPTIGTIGVLAGSMIPIFMVRLIYLGLKMFLTIVRGTLTCMRTLRFVLSKVSKAG